MRSEICFLSEVAVSSVCGRATASKTTLASQGQWAAQTEDYQEGKRKGDERIGVILRGQAEQDQASGGAAARAAMVA